MSKDSIPGIIYGWLVVGTISYSAGQYVLLIALTLDPAVVGLIEYGTPDACSIEDHKSVRKGEDTYNEILFKTWFLWDSERQIKLGASN